MPTFILTSKYSYTTTLDSSSGLQVCYKFVCKICQSLCGNPDAQSRLIVDSVSCNTLCWIY